MTKAGLEVPTRAGVGTAIGSAFAATLDYAAAFALALTAFAWLIAATDSRPKCANRQVSPFLHSPLRKKWQKARPGFEVLAPPPGHLPFLFSGAEGESRRLGGLRVCLTWAEMGVWPLWQRPPNLQASLTWKYQQGVLPPDPPAPLAVPRTGVFNFSACLALLRVRAGPS